MAVHVTRRETGGVHRRGAAGEAWLRRLTESRVAKTKYLAKPNPLVMKGLHIS